RAFDACDDFLRERTERAGRDDADIDGAVFDLDVANHAELDDVVLGHLGILHPAKCRVDRFFGRHHRPRMLSLTPSGPRGAASIPWVPPPPPVPAVPMVQLVAVVSGAVPI